MRFLKKISKNEEGQVLVIFAFLIALLMVCAALVIDVGMVAVQKRSLQNAADAAALAGAKDLPHTGIAETTAILTARSNLEDVFESIDVSFPDDSNTIKVECVSNVEYIFARVFSSNIETVIKVSATAQKNNSWNGESLPFINLAFDYTTDDPAAWKNVGQGIKGTLYDFYTRNANTSEAYFELDYVDGLKVTEGYSNGIKGLDFTKLSDGIDKVLKIEDKGVKKVYLFSLKSDVIQAGEFTVNGNSKTVKLNKLNKLNNGDVIDPHQLVLIECLFLDCKWSNHHDIELSYLDKVYDLGNNDPNNPLPDFPLDPINGKGEVKLIQ